MSVTFKPVGSTVPYFISTAEQDFICGPLGSSKTTVSLLKISYEAAQVAKCRDGIRRSRYAVVRNSRQQLLDSTVKDFLQWYPDGAAGNFLKTDMTFHLRFGDVESEILFRGLDDANDVRRLLSLQLTGAFMDEFREINKDIFEALTGRLGRYPSGALVPHRSKWGMTKKGAPVQGCVDDNGKSMARLWASSNPPDRDTFWQEYLTANHEGVEVTIQPSGLSSEADWTHLLREDYYEKLAVGKSQEWINVYIHGKWGESLSGKPVHTGFSRDIHVAKEPLRPMRTNERPLMIGMDFGLNPSAALGQVDPFGRLLIYDALTSNGMGLTRFLETVLRPMLAQKYGGLPVIVIGDPTGMNRAQTDERSCFDILRKFGFKTIGAKTNSPVARIAAVDTYLMRLIDGKPGILIDPAATPLINALAGAYRYKIKKSGEVENDPEKNMASHIADASQYLCLHADGGLRGSFLDQGRLRPVGTVSSKGWT